MNKAQHLKTHGGDEDERQNCQEKAHEELTKKILEESGIAQKLVGFGK